MFLEQGIYAMQNAVTSSTDGSSILAALLVISLFVIILSVLALLPFLIARWKIYSTYYEVPGWVSLIPIYNAYIESQKTFGERYGFIGVGAEVLGVMLSAGSFVWNTRPFTSLISLCITIILAVYEYKVLSRLTDKQAYVFLGIFIPIIGIPVIAFSKGTSYTGPKEPAVFHRPVVSKV